MGRCSNRALPIAALGLGGMLCLAAPAVAQNNWQKEIDYDLLMTSEGANLAKGVGVRGTLVEANYDVDLTDSRFAGKTLTPRSGASTGNSSSHGTLVAAYFFGKGGFNQTSIAPEVNNADIYSATSWLGTGYLRPSGGAAPPPVSLNLSRVASHAYLASTNTNQLYRLDYLVNTDDFIQVVAGANATVTGLGASYNGIAVGHSTPANNGPNGTTSGVFAYGTGRHKPDLIATHGTSDAIGIVSGAASMLIELGGNATLSHGSYVGSRTGLTIQHAQTSETIKAALMAGANRQLAQADALWTNRAITDYRTNAANQTSNGLDTRFGAGQLNINQSYKIIKGGEQDSAQDAPLSFGSINAYGFDHDRHFGGEGVTNGTASYRFATVAGGGTLTSTLAWNVPITYDTAGSFDLTAAPDFNQMELLLYSLDGAGLPTLVASSSSTIDNTQSIWQQLTSNTEYLLQVKSMNGTFDQDYSLAWRIDGWAQATIPEPASVLCLGGMATAMAGTRRRQA